MKDQAHGKIRIARGWRTTRPPSPTLALWVALIVTLFSGQIEYFLRYRKMLMTGARNTGAAAAP